MKAQISFIEYLVAFAIFITFVVYVFFQISNFMPNYLQEIKNEIIRSEAYQISEILVNDAGEPANWRDPLEIKRIGLSDETVNKANLLSLEKIDVLRSECSAGNYNNLKNWLDVSDDYQFSIILVDKTASPVDPVYCSPPEITTRKINVSITRHVAFDSRYGELIVQVW